MTSSSVALVGAQVPLYRTVPQAWSSAGQEAVELAASAGLLLDPWQVAVLEGALGERPDGTWAALEVGLIVPRQNGKGSVLEALVLAGLFLFGDQLILWSAHEFKTAVEAFQRVLKLVRETPDLSRRVRKIRTSHGDEGFELASGQRLRFVARSGGSGRGFSGDKIILDEAFNLPAKAMAALLPTMAARPNPQLWYTSSAPLPGAESDTLRRLCRRGRKASMGAPADRLAYFEWSADVGQKPGSPEWHSEVERLLDDPTALAQANPGMGIRMIPEIPLMERGALEPWDYARERLGLYEDADEAEAEHVLGREAWKACEDPTSSPASPLRFALDVSVDRGKACFALAGPCPAGVHVEVPGEQQRGGVVLDYRDGTDWVPKRAKALQERLGSPLFVAEKSPASHLKDDLEAEGVDIRWVSVEENQAACAHIVDETKGHRVRHLGQPEVLAAARSAVKSYRGDSFLWSRRSSSGDICPLVAVTLAAWATTQDDPSSVYEARGMVAL